MKYLRRLLVATTAMVAMPLIAAASIVSLPVLTAKPVIVKSGTLISLEATTQPTTTSTDCPTSNTTCTQAMHKMPYCFRANCFETSPVIVVIAQPIKGTPVKIGPGFGGGELED